MTNERRNEHPQLPFEAPDDDRRTEVGELTERAFFIASDVVTTLKHRLESDNDFLVFPSDSLERIAFQSSFETYLKGAESKVAESDKWKLRSPTRNQIEEMKAKLPQFAENMKAARTNANQHLRRKIASNARSYNYEILEDTSRDKQAIPARLRNARKDGVHAASTFAQEVRGKPEFIDKLHSLAHSYDRAELDSRADLAQTFTSALEQSSSSNANRYIYELGELWSAHAKRMSTVWQEALARYNSEFPDNPIDPNDPGYALNPSTGQ